MEIFSGLRLQFFRILNHLCLLLLYYTCFRVLFILFNISLVAGLSRMDLLWLFWKGLRFDLSVLLLLNSVWIFIALLSPFPPRTAVLKKFSQVLFLLVNGLAFAFEASDWIYFRFNHKRATADILDMISRKGDFLSLLPDFLLTYWYLFLLTIAFIVLMNKCYLLIERLWQRKAGNLNQTSTRAYWYGRALSLFIFVPLIVTGIRGGLQLVPINIRNAVEVTAPQYTGIVLNTPFSIINSLQGDKLEEVHYMPMEEARQIVQPVKQYHSDQRFQRKNVVYLILESFSKEFTRLGPGTSYTPFLDSLMDRSLTFTNAYANALHSNEGIPAILSGIPGLLEEPITTSVYSNNLYTSLPALLKEHQGYHTAFFHGCTNGTMSFDIYARSAGFGAYYGRSEYNNEKDYDGSWGIFDEPFLQFFARKMQTMPQPFNTALFTATSHNPYPIPQQYTGKFPKGSLPIHETIGYTDYALSRFFAAVQNEPWYSNTLFVLTADHSSPVASSDFYYNGAGRYQIPIILFAPGDTLLRGYNPALLQQIDLLPTILDYLGYDKPFFALGNSAFRPEAPRFALNCLSSVYDWINEGYRLKISDSKIREAYLYPQDSLARHNIAQQISETAEIRQSMRLWQAMVQVYTDGMINNRMHTRTLKRGQ